MFTEDQQSMLAAPLDPKNVKPPKKYGPKGDYIEGWHAIAEANRIFGFDGWSYLIDLIKDDVSLGKDRDGNDQWQAAYTCICTVQAGGVQRQDVGFGSGYAKTIGDAIEGATKEAATDALKRCLRTFGHPFGLALYDKERANVQSAPPPTITEEQRTELMLLLDAANIPVAAILKRAGEAVGRDLKDLRELPASEFEGIRSAALKRAQTEKEPA